MSLPDDALDGFIIVDFERDGRERLSVMATVQCAPFGHVVLFSDVPEGYREWEVDEAEIGGVTLAERRGFARRVDKVQGRLRDIVNKHFAEWVEKERDLTAEQRQEMMQVIEAVKSEERLKDAGR